LTLHDEAPRELIPTPVNLIIGLDPALWLGELPHRG
jgi:hypothetical protein